MEVCGHVPWDNILRDLPAAASQATQCAHAFPPLWVGSSPLQSFPLLENGHVVVYAHSAVCGCGVAWHKTVLNLWQRQSTG
jgi:hypothetical protein